MFNMEIGDAPEETADGEEPSHNKLETMIKELSHALSGKLFFLLYINNIKAFILVRTYILKERRNGFLKIGHSEKHTKFEKSFLMVWTFTK